MGLVNRVVPTGEALSAALALAGSLTALPQVCLRQDRLSVLEQEGLDEPTAMANELRHGLAALREVGPGIVAFRAGQGRHGVAIE
jgi:enoyl-CoA hydratase